MAEIRNIDHAQRSDGPNGIDVNRGGTVVTGGVFFEQEIFRLGLIHPVCGAL